MNASGKYFIFGAIYVIKNIYTKNLHVRAEKMSFHKIEKGLIIYLDDA